MRKKVYPVVNIYFGRGLYWFVIRYIIVCTDATISFKSEFYKNRKCLRGIIIVRAQSVYFVFPNYLVYFNLISRFLLGFNLADPLSILL